MEVVKHCEPSVNAARVAELLGVHPKTVIRMAESKAIPAFKLGRYWRFRESAIDEWMNSQLDSARHPCPTGEK